MDLDEVNYYHRQWDEDNTRGGENQIDSGSSSDSQTGGGKCEISGRVHSSQARGDQIRTESRSTGDDDGHTTGGGLKLGKLAICFLAPSCFSKSI